MSEVLDHMRACLHIENEREQHLEHMIRQYEGLLAAQRERCAQLLERIAEIEEVERKVRGQ